ncbi:MAG: transcription-repair coupling factor [bacterium]
MDKQSQFTETINRLSRLKYIDLLEELISDGKKEISIKGLVGSLGSLTIAGLWNRTKRNYFILTYSNKEAEEWHHNLSLFFEEKNLALLTAPKKDTKFEVETLDQRYIWLIEGLDKIRKNDFSIVITTPDIFNIKIPRQKNLQSNTKVLNRNEQINFLEFTQSLILNGFDRKDFVSGQGDISVRGGIVDFFPLGWENPLRIEFWGNEIESIREFDPLSQRSIKNHNSIKFIASVFESERESFDSNILDYLSEATIFVLDSPEMLVSEFSLEEIPKFEKTININKLGEADINIKAIPQPKFHGSVSKLAKELMILCNQKTKIILCAEGKIHTERFQELVDSRIEDIQEQVNSAFYDCSANEIKKSIYWLDETVSDGFILPEYNLAVFTEHEVFDRARFQHVRTKKQVAGISLQELKQLNIGDYVVHVDKGIGRFNGFHKITMGGNLQDCVKLAFAEGDILYVSLNYINKIQKYSSQEGVEPKLSKLGTKEWLRKKDRAKKRLKDIARDLIKLYAERKLSKGYSYPDDTTWQKEFEASFIYEDTPDQAQTTSEVKNDLQDDSPMDRLVCGDVGFGKTEIAIRAAFKVVQTGKQVAILVPTTILAQQHYMTFRDRLENYPVNVEAISRFRSKKEQTEIIKKVSTGQVDILIGTHRLLSKDVQFKDIGLLVIDEEHRFGVGAKEKLRKMKVNIDTLTLTATPIPRTLNFSLMGARDLSVIETPPRNRLPVSTEILEWKDDVIKNAIMKEIERKGQVFFVSDKVNDLENILLKLQALMPTVKFAMAHGQMSNTELERVMERFISGKFDVLVTTKIVESGLDIPNANTMLINRSHNFGLAELYQLRGRVGRSNTQAYCYLIIPPLTSIGTTALKRLHAVEQFTELGSGFQLAMRDMEIRGAGNLLGPEQSGYILDMGFELYHKILDEAVQELRHEEFSDVFKDTQFEMPKILSNDDLEIQVYFDALLPSDYIHSDTERFSVYKRLYNVQTNSELEDFKKELIDRFGSLPEKVENLIFVVKLRIAALNTGFRKVILNPELLTIELPNESNSEFYEKVFPSLTEIFQDIPESKLLQKKTALLLYIPITSNEEAIEILWRIKNNIKALFL